MSQTVLLNLLKGGLYDKEAGRLEQHIETVISNVFVYEHLVYKLYKNDNAFFNREFRDLSTDLARMEFTEKDFEWNRHFSPSIYLRLNYVSTDGEVVVSDRDHANEVLMVMNRVDKSDFLFELLNKKSVSISDAESIGKQLRELQSTLPQAPKENILFSEKFKNRIGDVESWMLGSAQYYEVGEIDSYIQWAKAYCENNQSLDLMGETAGFEGDIHSQNAAFVKGNFYLMDTFPPKDAWLVGHPLVAAYRLAVDMYAITEDQKMFRAFWAGYKTEPPHEEFFVHYALCILVSYLHMLSKTHPPLTDLANSTHKFMRNYFKNYCLKISN